MDYEAKSRRELERLHGKLSDKQWDYLLNVVWGDPLDSQDYVDDFLDIAQRYMRFHELSGPSPAAPATPRTRIPRPGRYNASAEKTQEREQKHGRLIYLRKSGKSWQEISRALCDSDRPPLPESLKSELSRYRRRHPETVERLEGHVSTALRFEHRLHEVHEALGVIMQQIQTKKLTPSSAERDGVERYVVNAYQWLEAHRQAIEDQTT